MTDMISCKELVDLVMGYLDGSLAPEISKEFGMHIKGCTDSYAFLDTYKKTVSLSHKLSCEEIPYELKNRLSVLLRNGKLIEQSRSLRATRSV